MRRFSGHAAEAGPLLSRGVATDGFFGPFRWRRSPRLPDRRGGATLVVNLMES